MEKVGLPSVVIGTDEFAGLIALESRARGLATLPVAFTSHPIGGLRPPAVPAKAADMVAAVTAALTTAVAGSQDGAAVTGPRAKLLDAADDPFALYELFLSKGWSDGLPVLPPT